MSSDAGRRIIVFVATSEGILPVVQLLPLSMFYELFGLPLGRLRRMAAVWGVPMLSDGPVLAAPSPEARVRRRGSSGAPALSSLAIVRGAVRA